MWPTRKMLLIVLFSKCVTVTLTATACGKRQQSSRVPSHWLSSRTAFFSASNDEISKGNSTTFVIGGTEVTLGSWPWQALLVYVDMRDGNTYVCGGTLISSIHILTAAHCALPMAISRSYVKLGTVSSSEQSTKGIIRKVVAKRVHPYYSISEQINPGAHFDIAVLQLDEEVKYTQYIQPICLPSNDSHLIKGSGTITGWGQYTTGSQLNPGISAALRQADVPFIDRQRCSHLWMQIATGGFPIVESQLCAGAWNRGTGAGDSGGPLQVSHEGVWYQVGITSFGENTLEGLLDQASYPGVFTRVSSYCSFIEDATSKRAKCSAVGIALPSLTFFYALFAAISAISITWSI
uniref:Peptidase S1 domain-containing protein n=1 Tax=Parascaris univalens TaxID=6257 RepID=A0A914ZEF7_PARUN